MWGKMGSGSKRPVCREVATGGRRGFPAGSWDSPLGHAELCDAFQLQGPLLDLLVGRHGAGSQIRTKLPHFLFRRIISGRNPALLRLHWPSWAVLMRVWNTSGFVGGAESQAPPPPPTHFRLWHTLPVSLLLPPPPPSEASLTNSTY